MTFLERSKLANNGEFYLKVKLAMIKAAVAVASEADNGKMAYDIRQSYAVRVLNNPDEKVRAFCFAVVTNAAITESSSDSDIEFTVNSLFSSFAGVTPAQANTTKPTIVNPTATTLSTK